MNLADFLRQGPLAQQRMADASAFDRDSELANMMRQHGTVQDPNMVQEPIVLGNLPIDVPQPTQQDMQLGGEQIMGMMPMAGITAFHGSPHKFTKFDMSKIGTGEGAQAYGHGIYAAENPKVAKEYRDALSAEILVDGKSISNMTNDPMEKALLDAGFDAGKAIDNLESAITGYGTGVVDNIRRKGSQKAVDRLKDLKSRNAITQPEGQLYKVDIPDDQIAKMLDWDKPLSEQSEFVRNALPEALTKKPDMTGAELYNTFAGSGAYRPELNIGFDFAKQGSATLKEKGIPGIKYLDGGSRSGGQGTSNFVLFADDIAKILERNDQPIGELAEGLKAGSKLPMDEASRMGRAKDMGHTVDAYHGTNQDIKAFDPLMRGNVTKARSAKNAHWFVDNPDTASGYADLAGSKRVDDLIKESEKAERQGRWDDAHNLMVQAEKLDSVNMNSQNIVPVKLRGKFKDYDAEGKWMQDLEESALAEMLDVAKQEGFDGLQLRNFIDEAGYGVHRPATHTAVFNPSNIRSKFAQFDPANKNSGNILAGAGAGFLASQLLGQDK